jgi:hypothetical protein
MTFYLKQSTGEPLGSATLRDSSDVRVKIHDCEQRFPAWRMNLEAIIQSRRRTAKLASLSFMLLAILAIMSCKGRTHREPDIHSGGLGLTRGQWEKLHGSAATRDSGYFTYDDENGKMTINFMNRAGYIKRSYHQGVSKEEARAAAAKLMPADSVFVRSYTLDGADVDLYNSNSLRIVFEGPDYWPGGQAGDFIVLYRLTDQSISWFSMALGNNT